MGVADRCAEEQVEDPGQKRVADVAAEATHRPRPDEPAEPVTDDQIVPQAEPFEEGGELFRPQVVLAVGVPQHDVEARRRFDPRAKRAAVAPPRDADDPRAEAPGDLGRPVGAAVVGDDHLALHPHPLQRSDRLADAPSDRPRFVQAGHHHRDLDVQPSRAR